MLLGVENAFQVTNQVMLSVFNQVTDLYSSIDYFYRNCMYDMELCEDIEEFNSSSCYYGSEGLLLIKADYREDITPYTKNVLDTKIKLIESGTTRLGKSDNIEDYKNRFNKRIQEQVAIRDKMLDDAELNAKVLAELEHRKILNIEILKSYGVNV